MTPNANVPGAAAGPGISKMIAALETLGRAIAPPVVRVALALPFLRSGLTRWDPFPTLSLGTQFLFENQFKLHLFGRLVDIPAPLAAAWLTAAGGDRFADAVVAGAGDEIFGTRPPVHDRRDPAGSCPKAGRIFTSTGPASRWH